MSDSMSMKYVVVDIETTGLDPDLCQILEVAMVAEDLVSPIENLPALNIRVARQSYFGDMVALKMNERLIHEIESQGLVLDDEGFTRLTRSRAFEFLDAADIRQWLWSAGFPKTELVVACGKNVAGFDIPFIKAHCPGGGTFFAHRVLDPGTLYYDPAIDIRPPSLAQCLERAGLPGEVKHTALADCKAVIQVMRHKLIGRL